MDSPFLFSLDNGSGDCFNSHVVFFCELDAALLLETNMETSLIGKNKYQNAFVCTFLLLLLSYNVFAYTYNLTSLESFLGSIDGKICMHLSSCDQLIEF